MKRFEYKLHMSEFAETYDSDKEVVRAKMVDCFNKIGAEGWEIVNVLSHNIVGVTYLNMILKREIVE